MAKTQGEGGSGSVYGIRFTEKFEDGSSRVSGKTLSGFSYTEHHPNRREPSKGVIYAKASKPKAPSKSRKA